MPSPLTLTNVTKQYGNGPAVLEDVSRTFAPGTLTMLVGPNGAGKTTLMRILSVLAYPTSGTVTHGDLDVHAHPYRYLKHVGVVHAEAQLPEHLTAVELLEWILHSRERWDGDGPERIRTLLDRLQLDERRANLIGTYSSGMVKKTQIAAALVAEPEVVLMDEPLRSLDAATTDAATEMLRAFIGRGGLAIVASHLTSAVNPLATDVMRLKQPEGVGATVRDS